MTVGWTGDIGIHVRKRREASKGKVVYSAELRADTITTTVGDESATITPESGAEHAILPLTVAQHADLDARLADLPAMLAAGAITLPVAVRGKSAEVVGLAEYAARAAAAAAAAAAPETAPGKGGKGKGGKA